MRKGEKGALVVYANTITRTELDLETGDEEQQKIPFMKGYSVFNVEQIEGLPNQYLAVAEPQLDPVARIDHAEKFLPRPGQIFDMAVTGPITPLIPTMCRCRLSKLTEMPRATMPPWRMKTTHWTRHPSRLERDNGRKRWGDEGYVMEELVVELGSAFLAADLALTPEVIEDHSAYIGSWLKVLKNDKRAIFSAAAHAQKAADYLQSLQEKEKDRAA